MRWIFVLLALVLASAANANALLSASSMDDIPARDPLIELAFFQPQKLITSASTICTGSGFVPGANPVVDGCAGAYANGTPTFKFPNCWSTNGTSRNDLRRSPATAGQVWDYATYGAHPPAWNVPACDYPIGAYHSAAVMLAGQSTYDPLVQTSPNSGIYTNPTLVPLIPSFQGGTVTSATFTGSIAFGTFPTLTVTGSTGTLAVGQTLYDRTGNLIPGVTISSFITGSGGDGTYRITGTQNMPTPETMYSSAPICVIVNPQETAGSIYVNIATPDTGVAYSANGWVFNASLPMIDCNSTSLTNQLKHLYMGAGWGHEVTTLLLDKQHGNTTLEDIIFVPDVASNWSGYIYVNQYITNLTMKFVTWDGTACSQNPACFAGNQSQFQIWMNTGATITWDYSAITGNVSYFSALNGGTSPASLTNFVFTHSYFNCQVVLAIGHQECWTGGPTWNNWTHEYSLFSVDPTTAGLQAIFHTQSSNYTTYNININMDHNTVIVNSPGPTTPNSILYYIADAASLGCPTSGATPTCPPGSALLVLAGSNGVAGASVPSGTPLIQGDYFGSQNIQLSNRVSGDGVTAMPVGGPPVWGTTTMFLMHCYGGQGDTTLCPGTSTAATASYNSTSGVLTLNFAVPPLGAVPYPGERTSNGGLGTPWTVSGCTGTGSVASLNASQRMIPSPAGSTWANNNTTLNLQATIGLGAISINNSSCVFNHSQYGTFYTGFTFGSSGSLQTLASPAYGNNQIWDFEYVPSQHTNISFNWGDVLGLVPGPVPMWNTPASCVDISGLHDNSLFYLPTAYIDPNTFGTSGSGYLGCATAYIGSPGGSNWWIIPWTGSAFAPSSALSKTTTYCTNINVTNTHQIVGLSLSPTAVPTSELIQEAVYAAGVDSTSPITLGITDAAVTLTPGTGNVANGAVKLVINTGAGALLVSAPSVSSSQSMGVITVTLASGGSTSAAVVAAINAVTQIHTTWNITATAGGTGLGTVLAGNATMITSKPLGAPLALSHTGGAGAGFAIPTTGTPPQSFMWTTAQPASGQGGSVGLPISVTAGDVYQNCAQITAPSGNLSWRALSAAAPPNAQVQVTGTTFGNWASGSLANMTGVAVSISAAQINQMIFLETNDAVFP